MAIHTANRPSHERLNNTNIIISNKNYAISTVLWVFEPSGTVAQHLGLQDIWDLLGPQGSSDTSGMTLWHAGTLLACWHTCWHSRQTHGIDRLMMMAQPSHSGRLQTHKQEWSDRFLRLMRFR